MFVFRWSSRTSIKLQVGLALLGSALFAVPFHAQMPSIPKTPSVPPAPGAPAVPPEVTEAQGAAGEAKQAQQTVKQTKDALKKKEAAPPKEGSAGAALLSYMKLVQTAEGAASAAGSSAGMEAARDLAVAISSTQNVFEDDLNKPLTGKLDPKLKSSVDAIGKAVGELTTMSKASLQVAATDAQQITNSLPYLPHQPRLQGFTPRFLVPAKDTYLVKMHFKGTFDMAPKVDFFPTLVVRDHTYKPVTSTASDIEFGVPIADLFPAGTVSKRLQFVIGTLKTPWETTSLMGRKHNRKEDEFTLLMAALPSGPGVVKFMSKSMRLEAGAPQRHTSAPYYQCSGRPCGKGDDQNHLWTEHPDPNCAIVQGSSSFDLGKGTGQWSKEFLGDGGEGVTYSVSTAKGKSGSSVVEFTISFTETCGKEVSNNIGTEIPLSWGESHAIISPGADWRVTLDSFDGQHVEFTQTSAGNPFLKVTADKEKDSVVLAAPDPSTVVWPAP